MYSTSVNYAYDTLNRLQTLTRPTAYGTGNFGFREPRVTTATTRCTS
jgi:hypothetical protein